MTPAEFNAALDKLDSCVQLLDDVAHVYINGVNAQTIRRAELVDFVEQVRTIRTRALAGYNYLNDALNWYPYDK